MTPCPNVRFLKTFNSFHLTKLNSDNSQIPHYKIAYNQGGATLTAFPVLSKIASIKRERSSVDYNRPLVCLLFFLNIKQKALTESIILMQGTDHISSGLTPQLQKLLQLPISKRETSSTEKNNDEKKEARKTISAARSNFGSNAYKQGGYEGEAFFAIKKMH